LLTFLSLAPAPAAIVSVADQGDAVVLETGALSVRVQKDPWQIAVRDLQGATLLAEIPGEALQWGTNRVDAMTTFALLGQTTIVKRDPPLYHAEDEAVIVGEAVRFTCATTAASPMTVDIVFRNAHVFSVWATVAGNVQDTVEVFKSSADEHFFGLGECWDARELDLKGLSVTMANRTGTPDQGGYVPFYLSTRGYGLLVDNYLAVNFDFRANDRAAISAPAIAGSVDGAGYFDGSSMLWTFYYGPDLLDVIDRFTEHVSRPAQPPSWAMFTTWQWRDSNDEAGVYADAAGMRAQSIPCGLIWIDRPWAQGNQNMPPPFEWQIDRFPGGQQMFADLNAAGYKTGVWVAKNLYAEQDPFDQSDLADPALVAQLKADAQPWIVRDNPQMYKIDRGNEQRMDPYFTCQAYWETWHEVVAGDFVTLPRTIANRAQKYVNGKWPGDNDNTYAYPSGLRANIAALLNLGIAGFPFWGADTGGFPDPPGNDITIRWAQFSAFCPIFETAGRPYTYDAARRDRYRQAAELYTRLFPYRWTYARRAHDKGHPICRPLALHYPDDPAGYNQKYEYLYGDWILVAPMVDDTTARDVYLPPGEWIDWWTGERTTGGQTLADHPAPLDHIPVFVRDGAIVPLIEPHQTWLGATVDPIALRIYPAGTTTFAMAGDDLTYPNRATPYTDLEATTFTCAQTVEVVRVTITPSNPTYVLEVHNGFEPGEVRDGAVPLNRVADATALDAAAEGWYYDPGQGGVTWVKVAGPAPDEPAPGAHLLISRQAALAAPTGLHIVAINRIQTGATLLDY
jgi:alpha-D-xyloside xylohydrolase